MGYIWNKPYLALIIKIILVRAMRLNMLFLKILDLITLCDSALKGGFWV